MKFDFNLLSGLLRKRADDKEVLDLIGQETLIKRNEYLGFVTLKDVGVTIVFEEAPWVIPQDQITHSKELYIASFHLHREGHEGYKQYSGQFPGDARFDDTAAELIEKLGPPSSRGGGGLMPILNKPIAFWFKYNIGGSLLHFQFDDSGFVEMLTLYTPNLMDIAPK